VDIDGIVLGDFDSVLVDGGDWSVIKRRRPGAGNQPMETYAGQMDSFEVTLKKTLHEGHQLDIQSFWDWKQSGSADKRQMTIITHNQAGNEIMRHSYLKCWCMSCPSPRNFDSNKESPEGLNVEIKLSVSEEIMET
jgi:phage tail-like protein